MPIINSLGTLTYPKIYYYSLPTGGWISLLPNKINSLYTPIITTGSNNSSLNIVVDSNNTYIGTTTVNTITYDNSAGYLSQLNTDGYDTLTEYFTTTRAVKILGSVVDSSGNIYAAGVCTRIVGSNNYYSIYVAKTNSIGSLLWENVYYSSLNNDNGLGIKIDSSNNLYIVALGYGGSPARNFGQLLKLNSSGTLQWSKTFATTSNSVKITSIDIDSSNYIYIVINNTTNYFIQKYDSSGTLIWNKEINTTIISICTVGSNIAVSTLNGIIVLDSSGTIIGQKSAGLNALNTRICADNLNNIYILASTSGSPYYIKICKFDSSYNTEWINLLTTTNAYQSAILSGIDMNVSDNFITLAFEQYQQTPVSRNLMWAYNLPVSGSIPKTGIYNVGGYITTYSTSTVVNTTTTFTSVAGGLTTTALSFTTASVPAYNSGSSGLWTNILL